MLLFSSTMDNPEQIIDLIKRVISQDTWAHCTNVAELLFAWGFSWIVYLVQVDPYIICQHVIWIKFATSTAIRWLFIVKSCVFWQLNGCNYGVDESFPKATHKQRNCPLVGGWRIQWVITVATLDYPPDKVDSHQRYGLHARITGNLAHTFCSTGITKNDQLDTLTLKLYIFSSVSQLISLCLFVTLNLWQVRAVNVWFVFLVFCSLFVFVILV